jgi:hypothetical protein
MAYFDHYLADGERIVYRTKLHPAIFCWSFVWIAISLVAFLLGFENLGSISLGLAVAFAAYIFLLRLFSDFVVTNRRVLGKFMTSDRLTHYAEVPLIEMRGFEFKSGFFDALFDYGKLAITDAQGVRHEFSGVPGEFYRQVEARDERVRRILR